MQTWFDMAKTTKATNGTVFMVYNGHKDGHYGEGEHAGWFDGQSQPGEYEYACEIGCAKVEWVPYYARPALHRQTRFGWWRHPFEAAKKSLLTQSMSSEVELEGMPVALEKWRCAQLAALSLRAMQRMSEGDSYDQLEAAATEARSRSRVGDGGGSGETQSCASRSAQVRFSPSTKL